MTAAGEPRPPAAFVRIGAAAALAFGLAWPAAATPPRACAALRAVLAAAPRGFRAVRGGRTARFGAWEATVAVAGGRDCLVFGGVPAAYTCDLYVGDRETDADAAYAQAVALVRRCLPAGWRMSERADGVRTRTTAAGSATGPSIRVISGIAIGDAYLVDLWVDAPDAAVGAGPLRVRGGAGARGRR
ncbi:MAG TPA: hypothetical protein VKW76_04410 [Candidatus Binatia bacterium]|nr:hypothetical protein [Candidatus Binatia bacterium]